MSNYRFREIYSCVVKLKPQGSFEFVVEQWFRSQILEEEEVLNKIEMKFEQTMLHLEEIDSEFIETTTKQLKMYHVVNDCITKINETQVSNQIHK